MAGFDNDIAFAKNADFTSSDNQSPTESNGLFTNGKLWIGSTSTNAGGTHINVGSLTSPDSSITIGYSSPNITLQTGPAAFTPNTTLTLVDDFIQNNSGFGQLQWRNQTVTDQINGTAAHPGLLKISDAAASGIHLDETSSHFPFILGAGSFTINFVINLTTLSALGNRYTVYAGLMDGFPLAPSNGIYLSYSDNVNGGKWLLTCISATVSSTSDTGIAATTGYVNLGVQVNAAGTSVTATINGVGAGSPVVTNIPTTAIGPGLLWIRASGTLPAALIDLFYLSNTLTTSR